MVKIWSALLAAVLVFGSFDADAARRMGGGKDSGRQSGNVTQRESSSGAPAGASQSAQRSQAAPGAATPAPGRRFGGMAGMLGGLAAGLGLAWLFSQMGLGAGMASMATFLLLALGVVGIVVLIMRMRAKSQAQGAALAYSGAGPAQGEQNASRGWERSGTTFQSEPSASSATSARSSGLGIGSALIGGTGASALSGSQNWGVPADFDSEGFLTACKRNFVGLQEAWDASDVKALASMTTDGMLRDLKSEMAVRDAEGAGQGRMELKGLDAKLLGIEEDSEGYLSSVEFVGERRDDAGRAFVPFSEVWNMSKGRSGGGWLLAGMQVMQ